MQLELAVFVIDGSMMGKRGGSAAGFGAGSGLGMVLGMEIMRGGSIDCYFCKVSVV